MKSQESSPFWADFNALGALKKPEDFIVEEILEDKFFRKYSRDSGRVVPVEKKFVLAVLRKRFMTTEEAMERVAWRLALPRSRIGYAGLKDKFAITYQYVTFPVEAEARLGKVSDERMKLEKVGYTDSAINIGELKGNKFTITLHGGKVPRAIPKEFPNYFGPQRLGKEGKNARIGEAIIRRDYASAVKEINAIYNSSFTDIIQMPKPKLKFFVHAYQARLFNALLAEGKDAMMPGHARIPAPLRGELKPADFRFADLKMSFAGGARASLIEA
ncbi:MAG: tRNA pseudouridine(13) synthase TruD, partial [Candidatus Aenigmarchaeota archaeon]|nr:tRNA pseudouridine(13) synthase TruD [Candidatus Aenigmarchaeota archaeon]